MITVWQVGTIDCTYLYEIRKHFQVTTSYNYISLISILYKLTNIRVQCPFSFVYEPIFFFFALQKLTSFCIIYNKNNWKTVFTFTRTSLNFHIDYGIETIGHKLVHIISSDVSIMYYLNYIITRISWISYSVIN